MLRVFTKWNALLTYMLVAEQVVGDLLLVLLLFLELLHGLLRQLHLLGQRALLLPLLFVEVVRDLSSCRVVVALALGLEPDHAHHNTTA